MTTAVQPAGGGGGLDRPQSSQLAEVIETILDKGLVIDAYVRVSLVGIEILTIDARVVIAGVDTYLRFAEAVNRLDLAEKGGEGLPDLLNNTMENGAEKKVKGAAKGAIGAAQEKVQELIGEDDDDLEREPVRRKSRRGDEG